MDSLRFLAALITGSGLLISLLAIPLILRRVPPNALYGVRTRASFASDTDWYRINTIGGRYLALSGLIVLGVGIIGFFVPVSFRDAYSLSSAVATLLAVIVPCLRLCLLKPSTSAPDDSRNAA